jgi:hypothetical protein
MRKNFVINPIAGIAIVVMVLAASLPQIDDSVFLLFPTSRWLEVRSIKVASPVKSTEVPLVKVDRTVRRPFTATWTLTVRQESGLGFAHFCSRYGHNDYLPDTVLPPSTDLNWWMAVPPNLPCAPLPPGRYELTIVWVIETEGLPLREVRAESNIFEVIG